MNQDDIARLFNQFTRIHNQFSVVKRNQVCLVGDDTLHPAEMHMLVLLKSHPGYTVSEAASDLYITRSAASQIVKKLFRKLLISKKRSPEEERSVHLFLTEEGEAAVEKFLGIESASFREIAELMDSSTPEELAAVRKFLDTLEELFDRKLR
jgi:DNA-binding MarR family transcriptional regulator